ncbi:MAG: hypothetical protein JXB34_00720 [Bacteroidales bacterium]|nr:hypothetical protein [Bacteroidales bacterium]
MRKIIYSLLTVSLIGLLIISCENKDDNDKQLVITGQLISNSSCKNDLKSGYQVVETPDSLSCVEYSFDSEANKLILKHINAGFNCCPDSLYCKIELKGDTIEIQEFEKTPQCHCNCLYDLNIDINGVELKKYQIKFVEPYVSEQNKLVFEIDLTKDANGTYCVTRKQYPWGMDSLDE